MPEGLKSNPASLGMGEAAVKAYRGIRSRIIDGSFKSGESLTERALCDATGVSRTPVREALRRLNSEGMVILTAKRGALVPIVDHQEIEDIFDLVFLFDSYSARIVAQNISDAALDELHDFIDQMDIALLSDDDDLYDAFVPYGRSFHIAIRKAVGNRRLINLTRDLMAGKIVLQAVARFTRDDYKRSARLHRNIYEAFRARDPDRAERALMRLDQATRDVALSMLIDNDSIRA